MKREHGHVGDEDRLPGVPDVVLQKAGPLDACEWSFIHSPTLIGERILGTHGRQALRPRASRG